MSVKTNNIGLCVAENGVRIVYEEMPFLRSAALGAFAQVGSRYESASENGITHFIEHMRFKGAGDKSGAEIARRFDSIGGLVNASTSKSSVSFYTKILDEHAELALELLADVILRPHMNARDVELEKGVIIEEINMYEDSPDDVVHEALQAAAFEGGPLARPVLGNKENVLSFTRENLLNFSEAHICAQNLVVSLAGRISSSLVEKAQNLFGTLHRGEEKKTPLQVYKPGYANREKDIEQTSIEIGYESAPFDTPDSYAASLLATALGGGMSSLLFQKIREEMGLAYSVGAFDSAFKDVGLFSIYASCAHDKVEAVIDAVFKILRDLPLTLNKKFFREVKDQRRALFAMGYETSTTRMTANAASMLFFNRRDSLDDHLNRIESVELEHVLELSKKMFSPQKVSIAKITGI